MAILYPVLRPVLLPTLTSPFEVRPARGNALTAFIKTLFPTGNEAGLFLDFQDLTKIYSDVGVTLATAPGQGTADSPNGQTNDKSGRTVPNNATQATLANRPAVTARINQFMEPTASNPTTAIAIGTTAPTITKNASFLGSNCVSVAFATGVANIAAAGARLNQFPTTNQFYNVAYDVVLSRALTGTEAIQIGPNGDFGGIMTAFNSGNCPTAWTRVSSSSLLGGVGFDNLYVNPTAALTSPLTVYIKNFEAELTPFGPGPYQDLTSASVYATGGIPLSSKFDGVNSSMVTSGGGNTGTLPFLAIAMKVLNGGGTNRTIWSDGSYRLRINSANQVELGANNNAPLATPVQSAATTSTTGGTGLTAATAYFYKVTAVNANGETIASNEQTVTTGAGATCSNTVSWGAVTGATGYKIYRGTATGAENVFYTVGAVTSFVDTGAASTAGAPPLLGESQWVKVATAASPDPGVYIVATAWDDGVNLNVQVNNNVTATVARPGAIGAGSAAISIGVDSGAATNLSPMGVAAIALTPALNAGQKATMRTLMGARVGLAL